MTAPTILVVEDDPALRTLVARTLQQNGYATRLAAAAPVCAAAGYALLRLVDGVARATARLVSRR